MSRPTLGAGRRGDTRGRYTGDFGATRPSSLVLLSFVSRLVFSVPRQPGACHNVPCCFNAVFVSSVAARTLGYAASGFVLYDDSSSSRFGRACILCIYKWATWPYYWRPRDEPRRDDKWFSRGVWGNVDSARSLPPRMYRELRGGQTRWRTKGRAEEFRAA